jgi:PPOX class probable F420-dependent enzyme
VPTEIPAERRHLLDIPHFGMLGTIRPDGTVQVNPMWVDWDQPSNTLRFTHTTARAKYRNLQLNPSMSFAIMDPADPESYLEVRGKLIETIPDPEGAYYVHLQNRYGDPSDVPPSDKADRVILVMGIDYAFAGKPRVELGVRPRTIPTKVSISGCCADASQASPIPESAPSITGRATTSRRDSARATDCGMIATAEPVAISSAAAAS